MGQGNIGLGEWRGTREDEIVGKRRDKGRWDWGKGEGKGKEGLEE